MKLARLLAEVPTISVLGQYLLRPRQKVALIYSLTSKLTFTRKKDTKSIIGTSGTRSILEALSDMDSSIATVGIGGINASNIKRVMLQSRASANSLSGVAVVSAIIAAENPMVTAQDLLKAIKQSILPPIEENEYSYSLDSFMSKVPQVIKNLKVLRPLCHNMTNLVVQNLAANVAIAM